ncbi:hypothetical protein C7974DRAFT_387091 [Boeremia exigua]|uniref:uncharacterized protein n=1 Tax=Boeremia exigua TaxID=749465 RepID=UPI001E8DE9E1|nr:uncharacterized protein C7974DRAFT_387091 [Boeremia exigua]KAH6643233.1 hypothetical protein C7974DRAFT_387091 [Boeremia exigua]
MSERMPTNTVSFCPTCNKPFTAAPSFNRHVSYCRRAQVRPKVRRRSCRACKNAKVKCSFQPCCARCTSKGLDCIYERTSSMEEVATSGQQRSSSPSIVPVESRTSEAQEIQLPGIDPMQELSFLGYNDTMAVASFSPTIGPIAQLGDIDVLPSSWGVALDFPMSTWSMSTRDDTGEPGFLTRIGRSDKYAQHSADTIIEALYAIPDRMLRRETFPPFIHPHWHLPALPEPLAVCMQLADMYSRAPEVRHFVWRCILAEQRRAIERLETLSDQEIFTHVQAGIVYLAMRLVDGVKHGLDWIRDMVAIQDVLCTRFLQNNDFCFCHSEQTHPTLTWEDWIYAESRRRSSIVWFLITRTVVVALKENCYFTNAPDALPLPAPQTQWEARNSETWMKEVWSGNPAITTFGNLITAKRRIDEPESKQRLAAWNARTDRLGPLLNAAVALV